MLTYEKAREFIEQTTKFGSILGLTGMRALMDELGNVQNTIPTIHIAGTNGKGSVGTYLAAICREASLNVGRYCSPAVFSPLECWQYNGENITEEEYAECMSQVKEACDIVIAKGIQPTVFEIETAMAFVYFSKKKPDVLLLETGMGGETDATNVVGNPLACVFTTISYDHMQFLGNTLEEIATIKVGIMKPKASCFWGKQEPEVEAVLERKFEEIVLGGKSKKPCHVEVKEDMCRGTKRAPKRVVVNTERLQLISEKPGEMQFSYCDRIYTTKMAGHYQLQNAALALEVFDEIGKELICRRYPNASNDINDVDIHCLRNPFEDFGCRKMIEMKERGIAEAFWPGRFEVISNNPLFIIDGAHNEDAAKQLSITIENCFTNQPLTYIIGVLADKEHKKMLETMLPHASKVYTITPKNARGMDGQLLLEEAKEVCKEQKLSIDVKFCQSIEEALDKASAYGIQKNSPILAFGSLSYLGELKNAYIGISERTV